jgi:hypothetical protein
MLAYDDKKHTYTVDGIVKPSVTQILSNVGTRREGSDGKKHWSPIGFDDRFFDDSGNASKFGQHFHMVAHWFALETDCEYDPKMEPWVKGLKKFFHDYRKKFADIKKHIVEMPMYSKAYGFTGTPDWYFETTNDRYLIDWKTGVLNKTYSRLQTAAYGKLINEYFGFSRNPIRITVQVIAHDYQVDIRKYNPEDWNQFLSLLNVWKMGA